MLKVNFPYQASNFVLVVSFSTYFFKKYKDEEEIEKVNDECSMLIDEYDDDEVEDEDADDVSASSLAISATTSLSASSLENSACSSASVLVGHSGSGDSSSVL